MVIEIKEVSRMGNYEECGHNVEMSIWFWFLILNVFLFRCSSIYSVIESIVFIIITTYYFFVLCSSDIYFYSLNYVKFEVPSELYFTPYYICQCQIDSKDC